VKSFVTENNYMPAVKNIDSNYFIIGNMNMMRQQNLYRSFGGDTSMRYDHKKML
jgi:hypothetical protein